MSTLRGSLGVLDRGGQGLAACFMSFKSSCAQIHLTTAELRIVNWEAIDMDEEFRKKSHPGDWMYLSYVPSSGPTIVFHVEDGFKFKTTFGFR